MTDEQENQKRTTIEAIVQVAKAIGQLDQVTGATNIRAELNVIKLILGALVARVTESRESKE